MLICACALRVSVRTSVCIVHACACHDNAATMRSWIKQSLQAELRELRTAVTQDPSASRVPSSSAEWASRFDGYTLGCCALMSASHDEASGADCSTCDTLRCWFGRCASIWLCLYMHRTSDRSKVDLVGFGRQCRKLILVETGSRKAEDPA